MNDFDRLAEEWLAHCHAHRESSDPYVFVECEPFEHIVALGESAIPNIVERYEDGSLFWGAALARITGVGELGDGLTGDLEAVRDRWLARLRPTGKR